MFVTGIKEASLFPERGGGGKDLVGVVKEKINSLMGGR